MWWPTFQYGFVATRGGRLSVRTVMPLHFVAVVSITAVAAGLGGLVEHPAGHAPDAAQWLLAGGVAVYFLGVSIGAVLGRSTVWLFGWGLPGVVVPGVLAVTGSVVPGPVLVWLMVAVAGWQAAYPWLNERERSTSAS